MNKRLILKKIIIYLVIGIVSLTLSYLLFEKGEIIKSFIIILSSTIFGSMTYNFLIKRIKS